jgi:hypothetical protein
MVIGIHIHWIWRHFVRILIHSFWDVFWILLWWRRGRWRHVLPVLIIWLHIVLRRLRMIIIWWIWRHWHIWIVVVLIGMHIGHWIRVGLIHWGILHMHWMGWIHIWRVIRSRRIALIFIIIWVGYYFFFFRRKIVDRFFIIFLNFPLFLQFFVDIFVLLFVIALLISLSWYALFLYLLIFMVAYVSVKLL